MTDLLVEKLLLFGRHALEQLCVDLLLLLGAQLRLLLLLLHLRLSLAYSVHWYLRKCTAQ